MTGSFRICRLPDGQIEIRYLLADGCTLDRLRLTDEQLAELTAPPKPAAPPLKAVA